MANNQKRLYQISWFFFIFFFHSNRSENSILLLTLCCISSVHGHMVRVLRLLSLVYSNLCGECIKCINRRLFVRWYYYLGIVWILHVFRSNWAIVLFSFCSIRSSANFSRHNALVSFLSRFCFSLFPSLCHLIRRLCLYNASVC